MNRNDSVKTSRMPTERSMPWKCAQLIARMLTDWLFDLKVYGAENVPRGGGVLIVSNHQSNLDPVLLGVRLVRPVNYIAKSGLFEGRVGGWLLRTVFNAFPVRQGAGDIHAVREAIMRLREGHLLNLYPEGARTEDGELGEMQRGVGLIIHRAGVPVIPAAIVGAYEAWPRHHWLFRMHPICVRYGPPMNLAGLSPDEIVQIIDRTLRDLFQTLRADANQPLRVPVRVPAGP